MGVIITKAPRSSIVDQIAGRMKKFIDGFMKFADTGFAYINTPRDYGNVMPKKYDH